MLKKSDDNLTEIEYKQNLQNDHLHPSMESM